MRHAKGCSHFRRDAGAIAVLFDGKWL